MPRIVTTIHDPVALAVTCRHLNLAQPEEGCVQLAEHEAFGWIIRLPGVCRPVVSDTLTGLVAYHPRDNAFDRYSCIMRFIHRYYEVRTQLRRHIPEIPGAPVVRPPRCHALAAIHG
jgi:hypothetical protein